MNKIDISPKVINTAKRFYNCIHQNFIKHAAFIVFFLIVTGFVLFNPPVKAQSPVDGGFTGKVKDEEDKPIANATVTFINTDTKIPVRVQTDDEGRYTKNQLPPGYYTVEVSANSFVSPQPIATKAYATDRIQVLPDFILKSVASVAAAAGTTTSPGGTSAPPPPEPDVNVNLRGQLFQTRRSGIFTDEEITNLPLGSTTFVRSFDELAFLVPGVAPPPQAIGNSVGPGVGPGVGTSGQFSVNGLRSRANNFMVDGSDNNDEDIGVRRQGFFSLTPQPIESIKEFNIITLLAPAQFGRNLGAQVNVLSKSGGNEFHGTLYAFFNSDRLNARNNFDFVGVSRCNVNLINGKCPLVGRRLDRNFINVFTGQDNNNNPINQVFVENTAGNKDSLTFFQGGGVLGGPIVSNKMFFFVSAEGQVLNASKESHFAVPTVEQRGFLGRGAEGIFIPAMGTGGAVETPPTIVSGDYILGLFPFPNDPTGLYGRNTYTRILPASGRGRIISGKFDYYFGDDEKQQILTTRYNYTDDWRDLQQVGGAVFSSVRPLTRTDNLSAYLTGSLTKNLSNVLRLSWGRTDLRFEENSLFNTESYLRPINRSFANPDESRFLLNGLGVINVTSPEKGISPSFVQYILGSRPLEQFLGPVGQVNISGFSPLGVDVFNFPQQRVNNTYQIADTMNLTMNDHNVGFGADIRRTLLKSDLPRNSRLAITSTGAFTTNFRNEPRLSALAIPSLISPIDLVTAGVTTGIFQSLVLPGNDSNINLSYNQVNLFAQDDFRVRPNLMISYGLRYELNTVPQEADRKIEDSFQVAPTVLSGLSQFIGGRSKIYDLDSNNFAPRIAFAYEPIHSTVIRGGYGVYYDQILGAVVSQSRNVLPRFLTVNYGGLPQGNQLFISPYNSIFCPNGSVSGSSSCPSGNVLYPLILPNTLNTLNPAVSLNGLINSVAGFPIPFGATIPEKELDTPLSHQYSIGVEQQFSLNTVLSMAYVGTTGRNLLRFNTPNLGRNNIVTVTDLRFPGAQPTFSVTTGAPSRPNSSIGPIDQFETTGRSRYDSLQFQLRGRLTPFNQGFQYQVSYTLAKAKDDVSDVFDLAGAFALPQDSRSGTFKGEYAAANFDVRHRFTYNFIYDLPELDNRSKILQYVLGGWQVIGSGKYNTGQPFTVNTIYDINQDGNPTDRLDNRQLITVTGDRRQPLTVTSGNRESMLAPVGQDGDEPRNSFRAGDLLELDMSFNKRFLVKEGQNILLRFDVFNFINRANFGIPVRFLEFPNFGQAVDTVTPGRRVQVALKYIF